MGIRPNRKADRNREILEKRKDGRTYESLAAEYGITWQRVQAIVRQEESRERKDGKQEGNADDQGAEI